ncbi:MAG: hypothetical protein AAGA54_35175, partial [Myxococcota bacterium]
LVAYDAEGNHRWTRSFGHEASGGLQALVVHDGQLLGVGTRTAPGNGGRGVIAAISAQGQVLGESLLPGTGVVTGIAPGPDGDLFLAGLTEGFDAGRWVGRYRLQDDALLWTWTDPDGFGPESIADVVYRADAGLYVVGDRSRRPALSRFDPDTGERLWEVEPFSPPEASSYGGGLTGLALTDDRVVASGWFDSGVQPAYDGFDLDGWVGGLSFEGELDWSDVVSGPLAAPDLLEDVVARPDGSVVAAGYRHDPALMMFVTWDRDAVLLEYGPDGDRRGDVAFDGDLHLWDGFRGLLAKDDGQIVAVGDTVGFATSRAAMIAEVSMPTEATAVAVDPVKLHDHHGDLGMAPPPLHDDGPSEARAQLLYLDFDGAHLRPGDDGRLEQVSCIDGAFDFPGFDGERSEIEAVVERVQMLLQPYDVSVVWEARPSNALHYTTVLVGGDPEQLGLDVGARGYACTVDCGNRRDDELVFAFQERTTATLANVIVHEAAHAWGLDHVVDYGVVMSPIAAGDEVTISDTCLELSELSSATACQEAHATFCEPGFQNAAEELRARLGPRREDDAAPSLEGLPASLTVDLGSPVSLDLDRSDDGGAAGVELHVLGLEVVHPVDDLTDTLTFYLPEGVHDVELRAIDPAGNESVEAVMIEVRPREGEGSSGSVEDEPDVEDTEAGGDADTDSSVADDPAGCACASSPSDAPPVTGLVLLLLGLRRRFVPVLRSRTREDEHGTSDA